MEGSTEDDTFEFVRVETDTPETILLAKEDDTQQKYEDKVAAFSKQVEHLCQILFLPFNPEQPILCGLSCVRKFEHSGKKDQNKLSAEDRNSIIRLQKFFRAKGIRGTHKGNYRFANAKEAVRQSFLQGNTTTEQVCKDLDRKSILHNEKSVTAILADLRNEAGIAGTRKASVSSALRELVDAGMTDLDEIQQHLLARGLKFYPSTVRSNVLALISERNTET